MVIILHKRCYKNYPAHYPSRREERPTHNSAFTQKPCYIHIQSLARIHSVILTVDMTL